MNKKGFTLIELLVVVLIIGILAAVALPQYFKAVEKSRSSEALSVIGSIAAAEERYRLATSDNSYTSNFEDFDISFTDMSGANVTGSSFNTKNFTITIDAGAGTVTATRTSGAAGTAGDTSGYTITRNFRTGVVTCTDGGTAGMCRSLGLTNPGAAAGGGN